MEDSLSNHHGKDVEDCESWEYGIAVSFGKPRFAGMAGIDETHSYVGDGEDGE